MEPAWKAVFFAAAIAAWLIGALWHRDPARLVAAGLVAFTIPFLWDAAEAA